MLNTSQATKLIRNNRGKFMPALIKKGDKVYCSKSNKFLCITAGTMYKVVGTALSLPVAGDELAGNICNKRDEFIIVNDNGERIKQHLKRNPSQMVYTSSNELFGYWEKL